MVLTRLGASRATFPIAAATAFLLRGAHGPWRNFGRQEFIKKTAAAIGAGASSMAYGAYKAYQLGKMFGWRRGASRHGYKMSKRYRKKRFVRMKRKKTQWKRRYVRKRFAAGAGKLQFKQGIGRFLAPFNSNFNRNDYDSCRDFAREIIYVPSTLSFSQTSFSFRIGEVPVALDKMFDYSEYKITNVQLIITPLVMNDGQTNLNCAQDPPYMYIIPRHDGVTPPTYNYGNIQKSPGCIKIHLNKKIPTVVNLVDFVPVQDDIEQTTGFVLPVKRVMKRLGWIDNPQTAGPYNPSLHPEYGRVIIWSPQLTGASFQPRYRIQHCATVLFRGYKQFIVDS